MTKLNIQQLILKAQQRAVASDINYGTASIFPAEPITLPNNRNVQLNAISADFESNCIVVKYSHLAYTKRKGYVEKISERSFKTEQAAINFVETAITKFKTNSIKETV